MGPQARGTTGRGTRRAQPCTVPGVPLPPPGHWPRHPVLVASPPTNRARAAQTLGISRPGGSVVGPATSGVEDRSAGVPSPAHRRPFHLPQGSRMSVLVVPPYHASPGLSDWSTIVSSHLAKHGLSIIVIRGPLPEIFRLPPQQLLCMSHLERVSRTLDFDASCLSPPSQFVGCVVRAFY